ncbi:hypothetical protein BDF14DRAFT_1776966 [Spinellus fusiger]|nr:hypothetical protein BDF14DRAFT_1776966 [Spinellus fusiger]
MQVSHNASVSRINYGHLFRYDQIHTPQPLESQNPHSHTSLSTSDGESEESKSHRTMDMISILKHKLAVLNEQQNAIVAEKKSACDIRDKHLAQQSTYREENEQLRLSMDRLGLEIDMKQELIDALKSSANEQKSRASTIQSTAEKQRQSAGEMQKKMEEYKQAILSAKMRVVQAQAQTEALKETLLGSEEHHIRQMEAQRTMVELLSSVQEKGQAMTVKLQQAKEELQQKQKVQASLLEYIKTMVQKTVELNDTEKDALQSTLAEVSRQAASCLESDKTMQSAVNDCKIEVEQLVDRIQKAQD